MLRAIMIKDCEDCEWKIIMFAHVDTTPLFNENLYCASMTLAFPQEKLPHSHHSEHLTDWA